MDAPRTGTSGTSGVLNGRLSSGRFTRKKITPMQTIAKASNVPIETNSPRISIGSIPARMQATDPVIIVLKYGVLKRGWIFANRFQLAQLTLFQQNFLSII